ncbi:MAG: YchJ family protein [Gammaproteobacteria bacterium]
MKTAATAETLMRSRFSAFVLQLEDYLLATWDKSNCPTHIDFSKDAAEWQHLEIIDCKKGSVSDNKGVVEFKAYYRLNGEEYALHEISRFIKQQGRWLYASGTVKTIVQPEQHSNKSLNALCSCGSGKKFKRCCGK